MKKRLAILLISVFISSSAYSAGFDEIQPADPLAPKRLPDNTIAIPIKKATLTHNDIHNQYVIAFNRFIQSNVKASYRDFKILIETMDNNDYAYMRMAAHMADLGLFNLCDLAVSKIDDRALSDYLVDDMKLYYYPAKKLRVDDEIYLGEVFSNIIYNDQSREATAELVKNTNLMTESDYANYVASLGCLKSNDIVDAETYINTALKMNPQNLNYKKLKAEILSQGKKPQNAMKIVNEIKAQNLYTDKFVRKTDSIEQYVLYKSKKNFSEKMYHLGYYYYYENELSKSVRTLQNALTTKKKLNKDVYALMSRVYFDMQDWDKAHDTALKALKLSPKEPLALIVLGDLSFRNKDYKSAMKYYKASDGNHKFTMISTLKIAETYEMLGKQNNAVELYEKLVKNYNACYYAYYKLALSDKTKELAYLKKSVAINLAFKDGWIDLGRVATEQQNYKDAKKYLGVANYIDENDFRYYYYFGLLAKKQGQDGTAYFKKSLSLNPDWELPKKELNL